MLFKDIKEKKWKFHNYSLTLLSTESPEKTLQVFGLNIYNKFKNVPKYNILEDIREKYIFKREIPYHYPTSLYIPKHWECKEIL